MNSRIRALKARLIASGAAPEDVEALGEEVIAATRLHDSKYAKETEVCDWCEKEFDGSPRVFCIRCFGEVAALRDQRKAE